MTVPQQVSEDEAQDVSDLIAEIYDAALEPALWPQALLKVRAFVPGAAAGVFSKGAAEKTFDLYFDDGGIPPEFVQLYAEKYVKFDPSTARHFFAQIEEPQSTSDLMDYSEFTETRFFQEWARPQGLVDIVTAALDKTTTSVIMFGTFRHERDGLVDDAARRRVKLLAPHLRRAVMICKVVEQKSVEAETFADMLDGLSAGMFLVDAGGRIVHANAKGLSMLAAADFLIETAGRLEAVEPATGESLRQIFAAAGSGDAAVGIKGVAVPLTARDGTRFLAHVLPLTSGARRRTGRSYAAVAALFVHKAAIDTPSPPELIAKTYKLTPTELRVLLGIIEVGGVPEVADALGIGETTVKTHLGRLYEKTGARRQVDLVKLVAGFTHPLAG